jgi:NTP pyrophosphatase (non-canonical NTP hydrolase)
VTLNDYRDEAGRFLAAIGEGKGNKDKILTWLNEETVLLQKAADDGDWPKLRHQIYDVMFLLFELASRFDLDLDAEWETGRQRKQAKYCRP